jgi:transposase-like protein
VDCRQAREALAALLGKDAAGLSATNISRLTNEWEIEYRAFQKRSLADGDYVYVWVDGVHFNVRLDNERLCTLVIIGVRPDATKELIAVEDGYHESAESWKDGASRPETAGYARPRSSPWATVRSGSARSSATCGRRTRKQRDWVDKLGNILDKLARRLEPRAKAALHEVMHAEAREQAREAIIRFAAELRPEVLEGGYDAGEGRRFHGAMALGIMRHARAPSCCVHCRPSRSLADRPTRMRRR